MFNPFTPWVRYGNIKLILTSKSLGEVLYCDHEMKPRQQYLHMVLFTFVFLQNKKWDRLEFWFLALLGVKELKSDHLKKL